MYTPADTLTPDALAALFTRGYAGYHVPVHLNGEQMAAHITNNDIDLSASQVAHVDGEAVGLCLLGVRGQRGWIGGVGVAEMHRRHGIGRGLMQAVQAAARERGMTHIQLEVLTPNENAKRLYEALGYQVTRRLLIIEAAAPPNNASTQDDLATRQFHAVTPADALAHYDAFHAVANPWQRASESLRHLPADTPAWVALVGDAPAAYAIARITAQAVQWLDVACAPDQHDALRGLLQHIHQQHPLPARLVNLDAQDVAWGVLESLGYRETLAQWEMVLQLETL
ncbi:MAG: GNAT family N-acetyltransferase [Chloroflexota bacterium]|nr:GNAT family N-acetyltransferase [Chloroflexota bacterium]